MSHCGGICGIELDCPGGCGVFCPSDDCVDCTSWCEPTTVEATPGLLNAGVLLRVSKKTGDVQIRVANFDELPKAGAKKYSDQDKVRVCLHELPRASVARLMGYHLRRTVRAAAAKEDERISGSYTGTVAELAARFSLVLE